MSETPKEKIPQTKKHLARLQREQQQRKYLLMGLGIVLVAVIGLIIYGYLYQGVIRDSQALVTVNGDKVTAKQFQGQIRYGRFSLIQNAANTYQLAQMFGTDPSIQSSILNQLSQYQAQMADSVIGQQILDRMTENLLIRQEAKRRGITVTAAEVETAFQEAFGYYPNGTSTPTASLEPIPTSTYSSLQMTASAPTATLEPAAATETAQAEIDAATATAQAAPPTATPEVSPTPTVEATPTAEITTTSTPSGPPTATATQAPTATPTPYTLEGYQKQYQESVTGFKDNYDISESDLRYVIESQLYYFKVYDAVLAEMDIPRTEEQVWARHILVADEIKAAEVLSKIAEGQDWSALAAEYSTDTGNKDKGGDLGWFGRGAMAAPFEEAAFALEPGQISGIVKTDFGFHIIQSLGKEQRPLDENAYQTERDTKFKEYVASLREKANIVTREDWNTRIPSDPIMPQEITDYIATLQQQLTAQPTQVIPTPQP